MENEHMNLFNLKAVTDGLWAGGGELHKGQFMPTAMPTNSEIMVAVDGKIRHCKAVVVVREGQSEIIFMDRASAELFKTDKDKKRVFTHMTAQEKFDILGP